jgi:hypothetical protein
MRSCIRSCTHPAAARSSLTQAMPGLVRVPLTFVTRMFGQRFAHIVLTVCHRGKWGAVRMRTRALACSVCD